MITTALVKEIISLGLTYRFRDLVHYDGKHGGLQADLVLLKELSGG